MKTKNGMEMIQVAEVAYNSWQLANDQTTDFEECQDKDRWLSVAAKAMMLMDPRDDGHTITLDVRQTAEWLYLGYAGEDSRWGALPKHDKLAWEAVVRSLAGAIMSDNPAAHSYDEIRPWMETQLAGVSE